MMRVGAQEDSPRVIGVQVGARGLPDDAGWS